jgi:N,N-dimethylformamidase
MIVNSFYRGIVVDAEIGHPIIGVELKVFNDKNELLMLVTSDRLGRWHLKADSDISYVEFRAEKFCFLQLNVFKLEKTRNNHIRLLSYSPVGYLGRLEASPGEKLELRVHSPAEWSYTLHRNGYQREVILQNGPFAQIIQCLPLGSLVSSGLDWSISTTISLPCDLVTGLYSITLNDCNGSCFTMPIVIGPREDGVISDNFLVIANTNTWQAYNVWGGKSRYRNFFQDPINGSIVPFSVKRFGWDRIRLALIRRFLRLWRLIPGGPPVSGVRLEPKWTNERLTINRPFPNRWLNADSVSLSYVDHLAANEWRGLAWLEREGYNYDYCSDRMLHMGEVDITKYKGVVLLGHAEYWTKEMYHNLYDAIVVHGIPLINLSGNAIYQEVKLDFDGSVTPSRGDFKETYTDPAKTIKTYTALDINGFAPYQTVPSAIGHWAFEGVTFETAEMDFGKQCLIDTTLTMNERVYDPLAPGVLRGDMIGSGASGWEIDKVKCPDDKNIQWLAKGVNHGGGAHMFVIETNQQFIFSASSIAYVSSLLIDPICSIITRNVLLRALKRT